MSQFVIRCPDCGTVKSVAPNMEYKCSCGKRIKISNDESIKKYYLYIWE